MVKYYDNQISVHFGTSMAWLVDGRVEGVPIPNHLRDFAPNPEKYKAVQISPRVGRQKLTGLQIHSSQ